MSLMDSSILDTIKKMLGIMPEYTEFDDVVVVHINSVFSTLRQLGIGETDYTIEDKDATWNDFIGDVKNIQNVKSYIYIRVRLLFDPPTNSFLVKSLEEQAKELEWRLNVTVDPGKTS